jgi:conjugative relaxase-like TrwC/TraI family protein
MLRVTTLYASSASATALYYTRYLASPGEEPGVWCGGQAIGLGLSGRVEADDLQSLLEGRDPSSGSPLGTLLVDRTLGSGKVVRAVAGFDATFSAPKSVSVWWALTGDRGLLEAHDLAVRTALEHLERFGATTRVRVDGHRQHPDTLGLSVAMFRQTTSRADDPQLHTHAVISGKVQTGDGRWWALDARYLKRNQRMLGGLYQSVLRAELTHRYGISWEPIVNGQAEIAGMPAELLEVFSKRARQVDAALAVKVEEFRLRQGRDPNRWERAALEREASADTRARKTGHRVSDLATGWRDEAEELGWSPRRLVSEIVVAGRALARQPAPMVTVAQVIDQLSGSGSTWTRADVLRGICDLQPAVSQLSGLRWAAALVRGCDQVIDHCVDLDPTAAERVRRRASDGRSIWLEPTAPHFTSDTILAEEERVLSWAMDAQVDDPRPSLTVDCTGLDVLQADAAAAVAGADRLVLIVGPAGTGKTTTLQGAVDDLAAQNRPVFGVAPTAKAARVLERETGVSSDTVAKLLHEWSRADRAPLDRYRLRAATTLVVDEAGMLGTASLHRLVELADAHGWRLALVGDPRQLQAVGRGGLFNELCAISRVHELSRIHRFHEHWEATASLRLRSGDPSAFEAYEAHQRIVAGPFDGHVDRIANEWLGLTANGKTVAITASTNQHVDAINDTVQHARLTVGQLDPDAVVRIAGGEHVFAGDVVATRRNDRQLRTSIGEPVRNRDLWVVTATHSGGALTVSHLGGHGTLTLPADYARRHVRLGYAATEHGHQGGTVDVGIALVSAATTHRGLYVGVTRGRDDNRVHVVTESTDPAEARDVLECVIAHDRADVPAVTQRRDLAHQIPPYDPAPVRRYEPTSIIPDWVAPWRTQLEQQREDLTGYLAQRAERRAEAATELVELQPDLTAARVSWEPSAQRIAEIEDELRTDLRPAMWRANHDAMHASFGHRHRAARQAKDTTERVDDAETHIAAIRADGSGVKQRLDALDAEARNLNDLAHPSSSGYGLEAFNRDQLDQTVRLLDAVDIWTAWAHGRPMSTDELAAALANLSDVAQRAPLLSLNAGEIDRSQWFDALQPVTELLRVHGINLPSDRHIELERNGPELGIGL